MYACLHRDSSAAEALVHAGADVNAADKVTKRGAVDADAASRVSATNTHRAAMLCCLQHGVTPLMLACRHSAAVAMQLIKAGAVVDQVDTVCSVCVYRPACMSLTLVCCLRMGDRR